MRCGRRRGYAAIVAASALLLAAGCTGGPELPVQSPTEQSPTEQPPVTLDGWMRISLPGSMRASTIVLVDQTLVVGGFIGSGTDRAPAMARADAADPHFVAVDVVPASPYGKVADLVSVTGSGSSLVALGAAHGGAHANSRWTIWTGTTAQIVDRPQSFDTFGGEEAGGLLDVAWDGTGPMIVGTWQGAHGLDGRIWRVAGERWSRRAPVASLTNTPSRQVGPRAAETRNGSTVISGSVIELAGGVRQSAAIWRSSGGRWALTTLADPGRRSDAWSTDCAPSCATLGSRDGMAAVWDEGTRVPVPELTADDNDNGAVLVDGGRTLAVLSSAGRGRLLVGHGGDWRTYTAPDGVVRSAVLIGSTLYVVNDDGSGSLWRRDLADVLPG